MLSVYRDYQLLRQALSSRQLNCQQLVQHYLGRIAERPSLNCFIEVFADQALQRAQFLDQKQAEAKPLGKLFGMVIGIKDVICYQNHAVSAASHILKGFESTFSATAVERLLAEDAIIIGRINCDEFAMGSSSENSAYGVVRNAADESKVPGGSSGGSAVAVQAGLCTAALGSDTGGSVRQPASFCGVVGIKPTYGRVSRHGLIAYASSFDQIGPLANTVADAALILEVISGADDFDSTAIQQPPALYSQHLDTTSAAPRRIAYLKETLDHAGLDAEVRAQTLDYLQRLRAAGHIVEPVDFPYINYIVPTYYILTAAEASSNLARFDGIRYGYRSPQADDMETTYRKSRSQGFGYEVKRRIMLGTFVLSAGYYDAYYAKAQKARRKLYNSMNHIFEQYELIITPTTPNTAFEIGSKAKLDPVATYLEDIYTVLANLVGMPAISLPLFQHSNGLPFGLQIMASKHNETALLAFSHNLMIK